MPIQGTIRFLFIQGKIVAEKSYPFEYVRVSRLPDGKNIEEVFRRAIVYTVDAKVKAVMTDLYRYLVFSNFARFNAYQKFRSESLRDFDRIYPFADALAEGKTYSVGQYLSAQTNTAGATLYLLMNSKNPTESNLILGGILRAMKMHPVFSRPVRIQLAT